METISDETDTNGDPKFVGAKGTVLRYYLEKELDLGHKDRYLTLLHEALHSVSVGMPLEERGAVTNDYLPQN